MKYQDRLDEIPEEFLNDAAWNLKVYRSALYLQIFAGMTLDQLYRL